MGASNVCSLGNRSFETLGDIRGSVCEHIVVGRTIYSLLAPDRSATGRWPENGEENCIDVYRPLYLRYESGYTFITSLNRSLRMPPESFDVSVPDDVDPGGTLFVGLTNPGMAGITAVDYLVQNRPSEGIGHISSTELPAITPFENGEPRHHTRLYDLTDIDATALVCELFVPAPAARAFSDSLADWIASNRIEEVVLLHGVPFPHGPEDHSTFYIASEPYRADRLEGVDIEPLKGGFLDGVAGELVARDIDGTMPPVGVYVTPTHPPGPDIDAAFGFLDAIERVYGIDVDRAELERRAEEIKQHYANLAERMATFEAESAAREYPEDRMFM